MRSRASLCCSRLVALRPARRVCLPQQEQRRRLSSACTALHDPAATQAAVDEGRMREALVLAQQACQAGEVPVGALLVLDGAVLASAHNQCDAQHDPTAHAELLCLRAGCAALGGWQALREATLYVTLEPCAMCAGALLQARVGTVVWGAPNELLGADGSWVSLLSGGEGVRPHAFSPRVTVRRGVLAEESAGLMRAFFRARRAEGTRPIRAAAT